MTWALIVKELRQHWLSFLVLAGLLGFGLVLIAFAEAVTEQGSLLVALRDFLATFVVVALLVLCNRLVVQEYQARTQLFLEALPLTRLRMVAVKFVLGLLLIGGVVGGALGLLLLASSRNEVLTWRFVLILAARSYAFVLCAYSFFFVMGLLGRYRIPLYLLLLAVFAFVSEATVLEPARFGPFALLDDQFAFERQRFPAAALGTTLGLSAGLIAAILGLALVREGNVATLLAERMSHREKVFVALLLLCVVLALSIYDEKIVRAPLDLPGAVEVSGAGVTVKVQAGDTAAGPAREFADRLHKELTELQEYLQLADLPPVFVVLRQDLDGDRYEQAEVEGAAGLLMRVNFLSDDFRDREFVAWLVRQTLTTATQGRAAWEPQRWVLDGFAVFWSRRDADSAAEQQVMLRAAYGAELGFSERDLHSWLQYRERVGEEIAAAVAWSGLRRLAAGRGPADCRRFLAAVLRSDIPGDVRGWWHDWRHPWQGLLMETSGLPADEFLEQWQDELRSLHRRTVGQLADIPRLQGQLLFEPLSPLTCKAVWHLAADPPPADDRVRLLYAELGAFNKEVSPAELRWEDLSYRDGHRGELAETYPRGGRLYWTFAVRVEQLGCDVLSGWRRQEIR